MRLIRLLLLRSLRDRPARMLLSMAGVVLGVAGVLAIGTSNRAALDAIGRLFEDASGNADLVVTAAGGEVGFPARALRRVAEDPAVEAAAPLVSVQTALAEEERPAGLDLTFFGANVGGLTLYGIDPAVDRRVREYRLTDGTFLPDDDPDARAVVLVAAYAAEHEIGLGDSVEVVTPGGRYALEVVGLMAREGPGRVNNGAFGVVPLRTAQELFSRGGDLDQIDVVAGAADTAALDRAKAAIQARLGPDYAVTFPAAQGRRMAQMLDSYQIGLNFLSGMALFVGAFLIYNAFSMTVTERTREFGVLRTIGVTRRQIVALVLAEAGALAVAGALLGVLLGLLLARGLAALMGVFIGQELGAPTPPAETAAAAVLLGLAVTLVAAVLPALQAGQVAPIEALRARAAREGRRLGRLWRPGVALLVVAGAVLLLNPFPYDVQFRLGSLTVAALFLGAVLTIPASVGGWQRLAGPLARRVYGGSGRIGAANVERAKLRTALTVAALMVGVAMIVIVRVMTGSFRADLESWVAAYTGGDLYVSASSPMRPSVRAALESTPGVAAAAPIRYLDVRLARGERDEPLVMMAVEPDSYRRVTSFVFADAGVDAGAALDRLAAGDAVFISSVLAEKYGLRAGDRVPLRTRAGMREFAVAAVVVDFFNQGMVVTGSWGDMRRYFGVREAGAYLLKVLPGEDPGVVRERVDRLHGEREHLVILSNEELRATIGRLTSQAFAMFDVMAIIAVLVAAMGIVNTLTISVIERTREIGMLRGIGMTRRQVMGMVLSEAAVIGLAGGLIGAAFGLALAQVFLSAMTAMSGYKLAFVLPLGGLIGAVAVAVVASQLAAALPARRAARTHILEAIQHE